jgi:phosphoribosyl-ATP pyrophosphohydrolase
MENETGNLQFLNSLEALISNRKLNPVEGSYTNHLFDRGLPEIIRKVGEEAVEVMVSTLESRERIVSESADLVYHLLVLLAEKDIKLEEVVKELEGRHSR